MPFSIRLAKKSRAIPARKMGPTQTAFRQNTGRYFLKAYGDDRLLSLMAESADSDVRNITSALTKAAPEFAKAKAAADMSEADITSYLAEAGRFVRVAKSRNLPIDAAHAQQGVFSQLSPEARQLVVHMSDNMRSPKRMGEAFPAMG